MDEALEASLGYVRHPLWWPLAGSRDLLTVPTDLSTSGGLRDKPPNSDAFLYGREKIDHGQPTSSLNASPRRPAIAS